MKISNFGSVTSTSGTSKRRSASGVTEFSDLLAAAEGSETEQAGAAGDVGGVSGLTNLLSLQEVSEEDIQRKKTMQRGNNLLNILEQLRRRLLTGTLSPRLIHELTQQLAVQKQDFIDPHLNAIVEDIELRAAVELAKLERAMGIDS